MRRRFLGMLLAVVLAVGMIPATALTALATEPAIPTDAVEITSQNAKNVRGTYTSDVGWTPKSVANSIHYYFSVELNAGDTVYFDFKGGDEFRFGAPGYEATKIYVDSSKVTSVTVENDGCYSLDGTVGAELRAYVVYNTVVAKVIDANGNPVKECGALADAVEAAQANEGSTVKLLEDIELDGAQFIDAGTFTIDLNGNELSGSFSLSIGTGVELTIDDTSTGEGGKINNPNTDLIVSSGRLTVKGGTLIGGNGITASKGTVSIEGGSIEGGVYAIVVDDAADVSITGGSIEGGGRGDIYIYSGGKLTLGFADGAEAGATFPGGISVNGATLAGIIGDGASYWQGTSAVTLVDGQTDIAGGDVTVKKAPVYHSVTVNAAENGTVVTAKATAAAGETVTLTVIPAEGFELDALTVTYGENQNVTVADSVFTMPAGDVTVSATFKAKQAIHVPVIPAPEPVCPDDAACNCFADVDEDAWYHETMDWAYLNGLIRGYDDGLNNVGPDDGATRAQIVTILWRAMGEPGATGEGAWYDDAFAWALEAGVVKGYNDDPTKLGPNDEITREQLAAILWRFAQANGVDVSVGEDTNILSYTDFDEISEWAIPAMQWAVGSGVITGYTDANGEPTGELGATDGATRAEAMAMIERFNEICKLV